MIGSTFTFNSGLKLVGSAVAALVLLQGCATPPPNSDPDVLAAYHEANDPIEPLNRYFFEVNRAADFFVLKPTSEIYAGVVPAPARNSIGNALANLRTPTTLASDLLQGELDRAGNTAMRMTINSTIGIAGLFDVADELGFAPHTEDFGQTLAVWGSDEGPFLMLPLLGPSNVRDTLGLGVDYFLDPATWLVWHDDGARWAQYTRQGVGAVHARSVLGGTLDDIERSSVDYYAAIRSLYRQRRQSEINNNQVELDALPDISLESDVDYDMSASELDKPNS